MPEWAVQPFALATKVACKNGGDADQLRLPAKQLREVQAAQSGEHIMPAYKSSHETVEGFPPRFPSVRLGNGNLG